MKKEKNIGIVGGVGPYAVLDLPRKIAEQTVVSKETAFMFCRLKAQN